MRSTRVAGMVAALAFATAGCSKDADGPVALGTLERDRVELTAEAHEPIVELKVQEGDRVSAGQILLQLDSSSLTKQLASARASASAAQHRLLELTRGPRTEEILDARARLEGAESNLDAETREYERLRGLNAQKLISQSELDRQRAARDRAVAERKQVQAQLTLLLKGTRIEELDQARDALAQAQSAFEQLEISAGRLSVRAPRSGVVEALPYELGERPAAGAVVAILQADGATYARVHVPAQLRDALQAGAPARVSVEGVAEPLAGRVRYVSREAAFTPYYALTQEDRGRLSYLAEVTLTDAEAAARLPAGVPVEVSPDPDGGPETASR